MRHCFAKVLSFTKEISFGIRAVAASRRQHRQPTFRKIILGRAQSPRPPPSGKREQHDCRHGLPVYDDGDEHPKAVFVET